MAARPRLVPLPEPAARAPRLALVAPVAQAVAPAETLALGLLRDGVVQPDDLLQALALRAEQGGPLTEILLRRGLIAEPVLRRALARHWDLEEADLAARAPDPRLLDQLGAESCLRDGLVPWQAIGDLVLVATTRPEDFLRQRPALEALFGRVSPVLTTPTALEAAVLAARGPALDRAALLRVAEGESCRNWGQPHHQFWVRAALALTLALTLAAPMLMLWAVTLWCLITLALATAMKGAAIFAALRRPAPEGPEVLAHSLPSVSVMVALYKEWNIATRLVKRLSRLDYPRELLEILLVVEEKDQITRRALARAALPAWMRVVVVPDGPLKTKPRALNHALTQCRGSIIGVYDAEDAPEPDQIRKVAQRFLNRGPEVACLQGVLDFYNPRTNWLSRCFTMEYASWFRIILPGLARMGLPIPLGGTTLFFRKAALERLGAWDAFNVTEDADLGMRLARHGYRTELIATTTFEEANCRALPWVKQRSRWLKGYFMTYAVHMRAPRALLRQLGWWKFLGFQVFFLTTLSQYVLAPVMWSFWIVPLGLPHPVLTALPDLWHGALVGLFLATEVLLLSLTVVALRLTPNRISPLWAPVLHLYFPLGALASYKALWELTCKPFYWDKTSHGHFDSPADAGPSE